MLQPQSLAGAEFRPLRVVNNCLTLYKNPQRTYLSLSSVYFFFNLEIKKHICLQNDWDFPGIDRLHSGMGSKVKVSP